MSVCFGLLAAALMTGCAVGPTRQAQVGPMGPWSEVRAATVEVEGAGDPAVQQPLAQGAARALGRQTGWTVGAPGEAGPADAFRLRLRVERADEPTRSATTDEQVLGTAGTWLGIAGGRPGRLQVSAELLAPGTGERLGGARWQANGSPGALTAEAGRDLGAAVGERAREQRDHFVARRAGDERLFFTPTALTLPRHAWAITSDELLIERLSVGVTDRLQMSLTFGGLPIPLSGATVLPLPGGLVAAGGGGAALLGVLALGAKVRVLDETPTWPGLSVSYDLTEAFIQGIGGGAGVGFGGGGGVVGGFVGTAGANVQFNVFTAAMSKHFGHTQVSLGGIVIDDHHLLPQSARFTAVCGASSVDGGKRVLTPCSESKPIDRLPTKASGFVSVEQVLGENLSLAAEVFPRWPLDQSFVTTGVRWLVNGHEPLGPLALDRVHLRVDGALAWLWVPADEQAGQRHGTVGYFPWLGLGLYVD